MADSVDNEKRRETDLREIIERVAERGGEQGASKALKALGLDADDPTSVQKDMAWLRSNRRRCDAFYEDMWKNVVSTLMKIFFLIVALGVLALLGYQTDTVKAVLGVL